jgi:hypothetical protein
MEQMKHLSADDLQDDVHRRFEYRLCRPVPAAVPRQPPGQAARRCGREELDGQPTLSYESAVEHGGSRGTQRPLWV